MSEYHIDQRAGQDSTQIGKIKGDLVERDKNTISNVSDSVLVIGQGGAAAAKGGIAFSGDVGGDLLISVGNTQIRLHLLVQIALILVTVGIIYLVTDQIYNLYMEQRIPRAMEGHQFNVAMAELTVIDQTGKPIDSQISNDLYGLLKNSFESNDKEAPAYELWPPKFTGQIEGNTKEERKRAAEAKAFDINADIILYGVVTQTDSRLEFTPEFYVSLDSFQDAEEIVGQHRLGGPLKFESGNEMKFYLPLLDRLSALSQVTIGLAYYKFGGFEEALHIFSDVDLKNHEGKEVVELLLANANLLLASDISPDEYLLAASEHYSNALTVNPSYARAQVGQAIVLHRLALGDLKDKDFDKKINKKLLDEAEFGYKAALGLGFQYENANIEAKVRLGLGKVYSIRVIALGQHVDSLAPAQVEFEQVVKEYENGNKRIKNLAGNAYEELGWIAKIQGDLKGAIEHYDRATKLVADRSKGRPFFRLGETYIQVDRAELALESFNQCIEFSERYGNQKYLDMCIKAKDQLHNIATSFNRS